MPTYTPYGNAIYGETTYGYPPPVHVQTTMAVSPIPTPYVGTTGSQSGQSSALPGLYNSLFISWVLPGGNWNEMILTRSSFGVPVSPYANDGVTLLDQLTSNIATPTLSTSYTDTNLQPGRFYYYGLFVYDTDINTWLLAASAQGLCLTSYHFHELFRSWTPDWYVEQDELLVPAQPLDRFFQLLGFEMNWVRSEIESLFTLNSPEYISGAMLPFIGGNVGIDYEPALGMAQSRVLVSSAVELYKTKGTQAGVPAAASAYTGYSCELTLSQNLEIQLDDAAWDHNPGILADGLAYSGHWLAGNSGTTLSIVEAVTYGVTPQHVNYLPIQGNTGLSTGLLTQADAQGYLPANSENLLLLGATSAFGFTQQAQNATVPPALFGAAMAYYPTNGTVVMFGGSQSSGGIGSSLIGTNQTWIFNGKYWTQAFPATSPPVRVNHAMAYDSQTSTLIMFGGNSGIVPQGLLNDTWSWNGTNWTQIKPSTNPPARGWHAMAQDPTLGVMMFGGFTSGGYSSGTWRYSTGNWVALSPSAAPSARAGHAMAYDTFEQATPNLTTGVVVLFGGSISGTAGNDTWYWNGTTWANPSAGSHTPSARYQHTMAYNAVTDRIELHGGWNGTTANNETWQWGGSNPTTEWQRITNSVNNPAARYGAVMAWTGLVPVVLYGGASTTTGTLNDTWLFTGSTVQWVQIEGGQTPLPRRGAAICYDTNTSDVLMFGGSDVLTGVFYSSTWQWNNATGWSQLTPINSPPGVHGAAMVYTTGSTVVLYGGTTSSATFGTVWTWNGVNWSSITPAGTTPTPRAWHGMVYDTTLGKIIIFGGTSVDSSTSYVPLNDTWTLTATATLWAQLTPSGSIPPARWQFGMAYAGSATTVVFGGELAGAALDANTYQFNSAGSGTWSTVATTGPSPRWQNALVYDSVLNAVFTFGGITNTGTPSVFSSDTWEFSTVSGVWTLVNFGSPNMYPRAGIQAAYNTSVDNIVLFGGYNTTAPYGDTWLGQTANYGINITECNATNAQYLGIPCIPGQVIVISGYVQPVPAATPTIETFYMQIDWYGLSGSSAYLIDSIIGVAQAEVVGSWVRVSCVATAPAGAAYFGRTLKTENQAFASATDLHLFDAVQSEVSHLLATPGPSSWTPPRDLQLNFIAPQRQLVVNGQGLANSPATYGFTAPNGGTLTAVSSGPPDGTWPQKTNSGFQITSYSPGVGQKWICYVQTAFMPTNPGDAYSTSIFTQPNGSGTNCTLAIDILWYATTNPASFISQTNAQVVTNAITGQWVQNTITNAIAPTGAYWAVMVAQIDTNTIGSTTWYLAAPLFNAGLGTQYFDGTFSPSPDFAFEGTPNESPTDYYPNSLSRFSRLITIMPYFIPIGSTFSIFTHQQALTNIGLH
jgi:phage tail-like protein